MDLWNWLDILSISLFVLGSGLYLYNTSDDDYMATGRVLLAVDFILFSLRLLQGFTGLQNIGPKIIMIRKMVCTGSCQRLH